MGNSLKQMQIRKLVKSGFSSLVIAVPKDWITRNKLKAGDLIYISDENNKLTVSTEVKEKAPERTEKVISVDGKPMQIIHREITSAYMDNYYYVVIKGKELKYNIKSIKEIISDLVALELVDESSEKIVARSFLNLNDIDIKMLLRRIDNILRSMIIDTKETLNDPKLVRSILDRDPEINKLNFLIAKILKAAYNNRSLLSSLKITDMDILRLWEVNHHLEKIGDRTKNIAELLPTLKPEHKKKFISLFVKIEGIYIDAIKSFYNSSQQLSDEVSTRRYSLFADVKEFIKLSKSNTCSQIAINMFNMISHINDVSRVVRYLN